ncbi:hypothetical protein SVI_2565 [Shewanella violacea DSS12]|uniref:Uncharacterized protein n=1 Tax=Shewanella violacea (strain JCM 10179 / CIP 106290 / LMG 19151 / DSS12) TaxID=637905 RepID=D4ZLI7_SHEVD|nr:hypothetical protein SVI_2565 [Shewanella violacea DSS12]
MISTMIKKLRWFLEVYFYYSMKYEFILNRFFCVD